MYVSNVYRDIHIYIYICLECVIVIDYTCTFKANERWTPLAPVGNRAKAKVVPRGSAAGATFGSPAPPPVPAKDKPDGSKLKKKCKAAPPKPPVRVKAESAEEDDDTMDDGSGTVLWWVLKEVVVMVVFYFVDSLFTYTHGHSLTHYSHTHMDK